MPRVFTGQSNKAEKCAIAVGQSARLLTPITYQFPNRLHSGINSEADCQYGLIIIFGFIA
ncbi:hypothetical protein HMPREF3137_18560 [Achromobacter xylosoxidans]|nr:hypothetical protein HMPREF3137_18560 [Achromobacter xylosoxidans]